MENMWAPWRIGYIIGDLEKTDGCIFCEVIKNDEDNKNHIVYRGKHAYVILNKYPYNNGHMMIVPYTHTADLLELSPEEQTENQLILNMSIKAIRKVYNPSAINIGLNLGRAAGAGIDEHIHYHILPRWDGDTNFMPVLAGVKVISESLDASYENLKRAFAELG
jgi:ATP adenylyltransferase